MFVVGYALDDMAIASVWITVVFMLVTFDVTKAIDEHGRVMEPSNKFASGFSQSAAAVQILHVDFRAIAVHGNTSSALRGKTL
ncbi:hypothetical protein B0H13DRAFT_2319593 [Mycena leptocephala]|nr:hypothetical protein B0H13DRAFT_2319593 [Mycena leptocephala]